MLFDQTTLFMATSISCTALAVTLVSAWMVARRDAFLLSWGLGILLCGVGTSTYLLFSAQSFSWAGGIGFAVDVAGVAVILGAAHQFRGQAPVWRLPVIVGGAGVAAISLSFAAGLNGLGTIALNLFAALLLVLTGWNYWQVRREAPLALGSISMLYWATAISFVCCAVMVGLTSPLAMANPPDNWAEQVNAVMSLIGITGIGAFSLALNQTRAARRHRHEAATDSLTGLTNRRALFDRFATRSLEAMTAVVVFDLDHFKAINDTHGHTVGDEVLRRFAEILRAKAGQEAVAARIGGEEFVLVVPRGDPEQAFAVAEAVREQFAATTIVTGRGTLRPTVSAGVAFAASEGQDFQSVVSRADKGLYQAKADGRDRVRAQRQVA